jgi:4-amino-4-deoxy-L-arabinose transferase-like glycosyltransferase
MRLTMARPLPWRVGRLDLSILDVAAVAAIGMAAAIRIALIAQGWPPLNSDEATNALMAVHILHQGEFPIYVYGQAYVGALEAYVAAPLFLLFGISDFALRFGQVILYTLFLGAVYVLARMIYDRRVALVSIAILSLGTLETLPRQLEASGGYMEMLVFGTVALLLASWLVVTDRHRSPRRRLAYLGVGMAWGLGFWSHFIVLSLVLASAALLVVFCRDELRTRTLLWLLTGLLVGLLPVILHDISSFPNQTAVGTLFQLYAAGGTGATHVNESLGQRLAGTMLVGLPLSTGAGPVCALPPQQAWPLSPQASPHAVLCTAVHGAWSAGFIALWLVAVVVAVVALRRLSSGAIHDRCSHARALQGCRLAVLGAAGLTTFLYMVSPAPALSPRPSSRYLIDLWIAVPCLVAVLLAPWGRGFTSAILRSAGAAIIGVLLAVLAAGTVDTFHQIAFTRWQTWEENALVRNLERVGATRIYTDYWTCDRIVYQSRERIVCAVLNERLQSSEDRYPTYRDMVRHDPRASYVFPVQTPYAAAIAQKMAHTGRRFRRFVFNFYVVYQPQPAAPSVIYAR